VTNELELSLRRMPDTQQTAAVQTTVGRYMQEIQAWCSWPSNTREINLQLGSGSKRLVRARVWAEVASYEYPRGNEKVSGPSIRLAEVLAQCWGNMTVWRD